MTAITTYIPKGSQDCYVESYCFSVQRSLAKNILINVAYVGNRALKLMKLSTFNKKTPATTSNAPTYLGDITVALNQGYASYNSLQARYEQRMVGGLTQLNSFTWSQSLDNDGPLKHTNFNTPGTMISGTQQTDPNKAPQFAPSSGGPNTSTFDPRIIQFELKVLF